MPFMRNDGEPLGEVGSALPAATLVVHPDKILDLKRRLEDRRDKVREFIHAEVDNLVNVRPPGGDPASVEGVDVLGANGRSAMEALEGFVRELTNTIGALDEAARLYGLMEESNTETFRQGVG